MGQCCSEYKSESENHHRTISNIPENITSMQI